MLKIRDITALNAGGRRALADVICYYKMTSVMVLDGVTSFLRWKDVTSTCKYIRHNPNIGGISSVQWRKVVRSWRVQMYFRRLLCVRIEIDQLYCVNCCVIIHCLSVSCTRINHSCCALMIWSSLQLTSKQWIITEQFTARGDLFFNFSKFLKLRRSIRAQHRKLENSKFENEMSRDTAYCHCFNALSVSQLMHSWSAHLFSVCVIHQFSLYWTSLWSVHFIYSFADL